MITPLMLVLSCIDENFNYTAPVDIMYLSRSDRALLQNEVARLKTIVFDDNTIITTEDRTGKQVCDTVQVINGAVVEVLPETAIMLTRIRECIMHYTSMNHEETGEEDTLDEDAAVLRLEGNPKYIYIHTHEIMENPSLDYNAKIMKLASLYSVLIGYSEMGDATPKKTAYSMKRMELQSTLEFWQRLVLHDYMSQNADCTTPMTQETVTKVKQELRALGLYGFVNPLQMYRDFADARVSRKVSVNVDPEVIEFLSKVIRSGGVAV